MRSTDEYGEGCAVSGRQGRFRCHAGKGPIAGVVRDLGPLLSAYGAVSDAPPFPACGAYPAYAAYSAPQRRVCASGGGEFFFENRGICTVEPVSDAEFIASEIVPVRLKPGYNILTAKCVFGQVPMQYRRGWGATAKAFYCETGQRSDADGAQALSAGEAAAQTGMI